MPAAAKAQRCMCTYRNCFKTTDPNTGETGVALNARNYRTHQRNERSHQAKLATQAMQARAMQAQKEALEAHNASLEDSLSRLSIDPAPTLPPRGNKYHIDRVKEMVGFYTKVLQDIEGQQSIIIGIPRYNHEHTKLKQIYDVLHRLKDVKGFISRTQADALRPITQGRFRNEASVGAHRESCILKLCELEEQVNGVEPFWLRRFEEHKKELEAQEKRAKLKYDSGSRFLPIMNSPEYIVHIIVFMVVVVHVLFGLPRRGARWLFKVTKYIVQTAAYICGAEPDYIASLVGGIPVDVRHATKKLDLDAKGTLYAACPACQKLHKSKLVAGVPTYRERCNKRRRGGQCKGLLIYEKELNGKKVKVPIKPFFAFEFKDWLANMMSRENVERAMDDGWKRMSPSPDGSVTDIFQASYIRDFKGPDKEHFSRSGPEKTGRYLFSLGFDFFNPYRNLAAGKKVSIGLIAIICLNLPIDMRYKPENIFLAGIIPGPQEPSLDAINPYFVPTVDEFLELWDGVFFTRTALEEFGRLVLCALILIIADLPAARKVGGFVSCAHELFCSLCWCSKTANGYNDFDYTSWRRRTGEECRTHAQAYCEAEDAGDAQKIVDTTGLRSSEFLRLPYYDPTKNLIVDPMHNLFLGLIKEHFQNIIGCTRSKKKKEDSDDDVDESGFDNSALNQGTAPTAAPTHSSNSPSSSASNPTNTTNSEPASYRVPQIHPTEANPLPDTTGAKRSVRKLIKWLHETNHIGLDDVKVLADKFSKNDTQIPALVYVGKAIGCFPGTMTPDAKDSAKPGEPRIKKADLAKAFVEFHHQQLVKAPRAGAPEHPELFKKQGKILTVDEMRCLKRDIKATVKPSWVTSIPTTIGSSGPKLKSDQWRAAGSLYLPITLVRQWARLRHPKVIPGHKALLDLTMNLFSAVCIATSRVTSERHADEFQTQMVAYRSGLEKNFPNYRCHPNHHMAMHLHDFIRAFGPVHGWWTFPFERMIGQLQRIPINYKQGEYEETIGRVWHRRANLKCLVFKLNAPTLIRNVKDHFMELFNISEKNALAMMAEEYERDEELTDDEDNVNYKAEKETTASPEVWEAFYKRGIDFTRAIHKKRHREGGILYTAKDIHEGNSGVLIRSHGVDVPFCIQQFVEFRSSQNGSKVWIVAQRHCLPDVTNDPFAAYPYVRAKMWSPLLDKKLEAFPISAVEAQFAKCPITWVEHSGNTQREIDVVVCVSLSRVQSLL